MRFTAFLVVAFLAGFTGTALAAEAADPSAADTARLIFDAVTNSNWWAAAAYGVILAMIGARKVMPSSWKDGVKGDIIGTASAFLLAFAGAIATWALAPGATMSAGVLLTAAKVGVFAIGGFTAVHKVVGWLAAWGALPSWLVPLLKMLAALVGSNAVKKAEAAGVTAVAANPSTGMQGNDKIIEVE
jgi:hypothetical protein